MYKYYCQKVQYLGLWKGNSDFINMMILHYFTDQALALEFVQISTFYFIITLPTSAIRSDKTQVWERRIDNKRSINRGGFSSDFWLQRPQWCVWVLAGSPRWERPRGKCQKGHQPHPSHCGLASVCCHGSRVGEEGEGRAFRAGQGV